MLETEAYRVWQCMCPECKKDELLPGDQFDVISWLEHVCSHCGKSFIVRS